LNLKGIQNKIQYAQTEKSNICFLICFNDVYNVVYFQIVLSFIMILPSDIEFLLNMLGFISWLMYGLGMVAHLVLRYKMKHVQRPLRVS
jgi:amino acid transporter